MILCNSCIPVNSCLPQAFQIPFYILCDVIDNEKVKQPELSPGKRIAKQVQERHERRQFYVDSLTGPERSLLAARFIRRIPEKYRRMALREMSIADLAYGEVFSVEIYGW